eukprot:gene62805-85892_t
MKPCRSSVPGFMCSSAKFCMVSARSSRHRGASFANPNEPARMSNEQLADLTQPQRDRLAFVELRVRFIGEIRRQDLVTRFGIQSAAASRDLALYKELAPGNIDYDPK